MSRRTLFIIAGVLIVVLAASGIVLWRQRDARAQRRRIDPVVSTAVALVALERAPALASVRLTRAQIDRIVPLLRVLRQTDPNDRDATATLVRDIQGTLTKEQVAALEQFRDRARERAQQQGREGRQGGRQGGGRQGGARRPPGAEGVDPRTVLLTIRQRFIDRAIRVLERARANAPVGAP